MEKEPQYSDAATGAAIIAIPTFPFLVLGVVFQSLDFAQVARARRNADYIDTSGEFRPGTDILTANGQFAGFCFAKVISSEWDFDPGCHHGIDSSC